MANTILHKRSSTTGSTPTGAQLASGELALNTADGKVFMKNSSGTVIEVSYRDARVRGALSGSAGVAYDSSTGAFTVDSTVATLTGTQTLTNKTLTAPAITNPTISSGGAFGTPTSITLTNATGLPVSTGISGLGAGVATFLATPSSANLASAVTDETGTGALVFANSPTLVTPTLGAASATSLTTTGNVTVGGNATITGNLTVNGTTTTINSTAVSVDDINVILGDTASPSDATADGGGITLKGTTDKTLNYVSANTAWTSSENFDLLTGKVYTINGTSVLSATTLGSGVVNSSLTSVGTIGTGTWQGTIVAPTYGGTGVNNGSKTITLGGNLTTSGAFATTLTATAATSVTLPTTGTLATLAGAETLTNKTISGSSNTLSNIANASLTNSKVTIGSTDVSLGATATTLAGLTSVTSTGFTGSLTGNASTATALQTARTINGVSFDGSGNITITATATGALTIGTGLSGTSYNGSAGVTIAIDSTVATLTGAQTLTNKTLTAPNVTALNIRDSSIIFEGATDDASETTLTVVDPTQDNTITLPNVTGTVITTGDTGTVTNTMLAGSIANAKLANSTISGVSLGSNLNALTIGTGLSGTSYNGSAGVTVAIDGTVATLTGTQTLTNKTLTAPTITSPTVTGLFLNDGSLVFEGATADAFETTLAVVDPTADRTITLPDVTGTVITTGDSGTVTNTMLAGSIANAKLVNSSTTIGTTAIALGASSTTLAGLTSVTSTGFTGALTGNASTATTLQTPRAIQGVNFDGSAAITVVTAGTGVSVSGTQVSIGQAVGTTSNVTFNDLTVSGNLTVSGTTTSINTTTLDVADLNITVAKNAATAAAANGAGLTVAGPATPATLTYTSADDRWNLNKSLTVGTVYGNLTGNVTGTVSGNAGTVTNGVYTTDTGTVTNTMLAGSIANAKLVNSSVTVGTTAISLGSSSTTLAGLTSVTSTGFTGALTGNASTATTLQTARAINGVNFDGSAAITVTAAAGTLTGATLNSTVTGSSLTSVGTLGTLTVSGATATGALTVSGAITATGEVTAYFSDLRLKTNIVPIEDALEKVEAINGVTFDPNEDALALGIDDRHQMGVIAQEIEAVAPELVTESAFKGYKTVRYDKLTALLIEAVKELSAKVKVLEAQVGSAKPEL
jgi:hypothetical protein